MREQADAAERRKDDEEKDEAEDEEEEEEEAEEEAVDDGDDDEGAKPKKKKAPAKKKAAPKKAKAPAKPRTRTPKIVRMKIVWVVYSNSHAVLQEFPYPQKAEAEAYLEKVTNDKKSGGPFFLQPLKKPMDKE